MLNLGGVTEMIQPTNQQKKRSNQPTNSNRNWTNQQKHHIKHTPDMSAICWVKKVSTIFKHWRDETPDWTFGGVLQVFWKPIWGDWWVDCMGASNFQVPKNEVHIINYSQVVTSIFWVDYVGVSFTHCVPEMKACFEKRTAMYSQED